jgi:hypothetical protein
MRVRAVSSFRHSSACKFRRYVARVVSNECAMHSRKSSNLGELKERIKSTLEEETREGKKFIYSDRSLNSSVGVNRTSLLRLEVTRIFVGTCNDFDCDHSRRRYVEAEPGVEVKVYPLDDFLNFRWHVFVNFKIHEL